ncbi:MAG: phosphoglucosamine mutase [Egibacteraceae bacterium]
MGRLFGTDGVRGVANTELTPELAMGLGRSLVCTLREREAGACHPRVVLGRDPRASGEMLEAALVAGICSAGGEAVVIGVIPTPGVAFLVTTLGADSGAMISASHNPVEDNGIKFFGRDGFKLSDGEEDRIAALLDEIDPRPPTGASVGRVRRAYGVIEAYEAHLVATARGADLSSLRVVVDCANGAASKVAPAVLRRLGCDVTAIHAIPDGTNINDGCGSTHPSVVAAAVLDAKADVGLAHDGDADRLIAVDHMGAMVDGDVILAILAARMQRKRSLDGVVTTVMTNLGFRQAMERLGVEVIQTSVGDRCVLDAMRSGGYPLGGEQSGHLIFAEHATTGDGVLTAVQLLTAVVEEGKTLAQLAQVMRRLPQVLVNVRGVDRGRLDGAERLWKAVAEEEAGLGSAGRVLVRASGTEPIVRIMVEADQEAHATAIADRLAAIAAAELAL